ncbi:MAG: pseudouridine synthase, partial [Hyphomicrobiaceae bacterium]
ARFNGSKRSFGGPRTSDGGKRPFEGRPGRAEGANRSAEGGKRFEGSKRTFESGARDEATKPTRFKRARLDRNAPPERDRSEPGRDTRPYRERNDETRRDRPDRDAARPERSERHTAHRSFGDTRQRERDRAARAAPHIEQSEAPQRERTNAQRPQRSEAPNRDRNDTRAPARTAPSGHQDRSEGRRPEQRTRDRPEQERTRNPAPRSTPTASGERGFKVKPMPNSAPGRAPASSDTSGSPSEPMRIAKAMARSGLCSRRDAERWIAEGRVAVNGRILNTPAIEVGPTDKIVVDGQPLPAAEPAQIWRYYKPRGLVTTHSDPEGRPTVFDALPPDMPRVVSIGRLDFNTEGLLLLTNDGELARHLELPATGWLRRYRVRAYGRVSQSDLDALKDGVTIEGVRYGGIEAHLDSVQAGNMWLTIGLREGKNREVRRILGSLALEVNRLIRISYGPFQLTDLTPGMVEPIKRRVLADQLGPEAASFGLTGAIDGYKARQSKLPGYRKPKDDE